MICKTCGYQFKGTYKIINDKDKYITNPELTCPRCKSKNLMLKSRLKKYFKCNSCGYPTRIREQTRIQLILQRERDRNATYAALNIWLLSPKKNMIILKDSFKKSIILRRLHSFE
jgi:DNA-directed RNA polymerase subunit RPC12/RpoP